MIEHDLPPEAPEEAAQIVAIQGSAQIARTVESALKGEWGALTSYASSTYTHAWWCDRTQRDLEPILRMLSHTLTLKAYEGLDVVVACDFYKVPPSHDVGGLWTNTMIGDLIHRWKYRSRSRSTEPPERLVQWIARIVQLHPMTRNLEVIVITPSTKTGASERLGRAVADHLGVSTEMPTLESLRNRPAKEGRASDELDLYRFESSLEALDVVIIDDVLRSGLTVRSVAAAAHEAGAQNVSAVVVARTMRNR